MILIDETGHLLTVNSILLTLLEKINALFTTTIPVPGRIVRISSLFFGLSQFCRSMNLILTIIERIQVYNNTTVRHETRSHCHRSQSVRCRGSAEHVDHHRSQCEPKIRITTQAYYFDPKVEAPTKTLIVQSIRLADLIAPGTNYNNNNNNNNSQGLTCRRWPRLKRKEKKRKYDQYKDRDRYFLKSIQGETK